VSKKDKGGNPKKKQQIIGGEPVSVHYTDERGIQVYVRMPRNAAELWRLELELTKKEFYTEPPRADGITFQPFKTLSDINDTASLPPYKIKIDVGIFVFKNWETAELLVRIMKFGFKTKDILSQPMVLTPWVWEIITGTKILEELTPNIREKLCTECNTYFRTVELKAKHRCSSERASER